MEYDIPFSFIITFATFCDANDAKTISGIFTKNGNATVDCFVNSDVIMAHPTNPVE